MRHRINSAWVNAVFVVSGTTTVALLTPAACAQTVLRSPIHLEAAVVNSNALATIRTAAAPRRILNAPSAPRARAKVQQAQKTLPSAPRLKLEAKAAAQQVLRDDQASRQQLVRMNLGGVESAGTSGRNIAPHVMQNLRETAAPPMIEMGDRPARSQSLCGDGKYRRFAELDSKTVAALLPEFNALRPRTVCARRGVLIADYAFK